MDVIEDKALICDSPNCMKFFVAVKMNISIVIDDKFISIYDGNFSKTLHISKTNNQYDLILTLLKTMKQLSMCLIYRLNL